jgi:hypothetical protein
MAVQHYPVFGRETKKVINSLFSFLEFSLALLPVAAFFFAIGRGYIILVRRKHPEKKLTRFHFYVALLITLVGFWATIYIFSAWQS